MFIHEKMPEIRSSALLWTTTHKKDSSLGVSKKEGHEADFYPQGMAALYPSVLLLWCACMLWSIGIGGVLSSADISSNVVDISRGFEDLIPSMFEEL